jgi:DNA-binding MarR family transcriptional regulator
MLAEGPMGMAELARCFGVEKAALTGLVDRVERRGLAKRTPVHGDRRAWHVTLTEAGRRAAAAFQSKVTAELESLLPALAPDDREHFRRGMVAIIAGCGAGGPRGGSHHTKPLRNSSGAMC